MRIAIVTFEFEGITRNGGIGTAYRRLSTLLAADGHRVSVGLAARPGDPRPVSARMRALGRELGIRIEAIPSRKTNALWMLARSAEARAWLEKGRHELVHASEVMGLAYHALVAKRKGEAFAGTRFVIGVHGPTLWVEEAHDRLRARGKRDLHENAVDCLERKTVEYADVVVSPSRYMLGYLRERGWSCPRSTFVIPNANAACFPLKRRGNSSRPALRGLLFFGRLEPRKGLRAFVEALVLLLRKNTPATIPVHFLGKDMPFENGRTGSEFVRESLARYADRVALEFHMDFSSDEATRFLRERGAEFLVCMPSRMDNSPYTIVEALELGLNFVSSDRGGQGELIHAADRGRALLRPSARTLARTFSDKLGASPSAARPSRSVVNANEAWIGLHRALAAKRPCALTRARS